MRGQFSILSTGHLTLLFLTLYCITDNIFNYLIDGLSGLSKMFTDRDNGFTNNQIVRTILSEINRSVFKCRFRLIPVIIKLGVPFFDNFRWRTENRIEATAPYIQFIIGVVIVCYPAFYLVLNHATFKQIKKRHNINYSDGFYIGLLYAVPLVLS